MALRYKDITFLSLRKPPRQDTGLCRPLLSPVQSLSWSQAQKLEGNWGPEEPSCILFFHEDHKTVYKMNSPTSSWYSCPTDFELGFPGVPYSLSSLFLRGRIYAKHSRWYPKHILYHLCSPGVNSLLFLSSRHFLHLSFAMLWEVLQELLGFLSELPTHHTDPHHKATPPKAPAIQPSHSAPCFSWLEDILLWHWGDERPSFKLSFYRILPHIFN